MGRKIYTIATRASRLACIQAEMTLSMLKARFPGCEFTIRKYSTTGDKETSVPLTTFGGTGVFVKELENALLNEEADIAVHSSKDIPSATPEGLVLQSFLEREVVNDVLLSRHNLSLAELPVGVVVGTGSPRRIVQLSALRPDFEYRDIRGNIDTRIRKMETGEYDAIVLAAAGLKRFGLPFPEQSVLDISVCLPAVGQGAIALECREDDAEVRDMLESLNHHHTRCAVEAERAYMKEMEGGCRFPMAALAVVEGDMIKMEVMAGDTEMKKMMRIKGIEKASEAKELGKKMALEMKEECAKENINLSYG